MNDSTRHSIPTDAKRAHLVALQNLNIGANGRWFVLALVAIAIAAGLFKTAVLLTLPIGLSVLIEQLPGRWRAIGAYLLYCLTAGMVLMLLVLV